MDPHSCDEWCSVGVKEGISQWILQMKCMLHVFEDYWWDSLMYVHVHDPCFTNSNYIWLDLIQGHDTSGVGVG